MVKNDNILCEQLMCGSCRLQPFEDIGLHCQKEAKLKTNETKTQVYIRLMIFLTCTKQNGKGETYSVKNKLLPDNSEIKPNS